MCGGGYTGDERGQRAGECVGRERFAALCLLPLLHSSPPHNLSPDVFWGGGGGGGGGWWGGVVLYYVRLLHHSLPARQDTNPTTKLTALLPSPCRLLPPLYPPPQLRGHSPDGSLPWLDGGYKDWEHFQGGAFGDYQLWTMRDELIPQYYK